MIIHELRQEMDDEERRRKANRQYPDAIEEDRDTPFEEKKSYYTPKLREWSSQQRKRK